MGNGYAHLAFVVEDADEHHATMTSKGHDVGDLVDFTPRGAPVARFFFATDTDGYKIEVIQKGGRLG